MIAMMTYRTASELADRFGEAYLAYQRSTPFIVPRSRGASRGAGQGMAQSAK